MNMVKITVWGVVKGLGSALFNLLSFPLVYLVAMEIQTIPQTVMEELRYLKKRHRLNELKSDDISRSVLEILTQCLCVFFWAWIPAIGLIMTGTIIYGGLGFICYVLYKLIT